MTATFVVIANFAWQHLKAATTFRDRVEALETENLGRPFGPYFEDIRSYASACLMSSAASLEALINEHFIAHDSPLRAGLTDFEKEFWGGIERKAILEKYQRGLQMLGAPLFDRLASPYRDVWALIELRNALVHYKPTWDPAQHRKVELIEVLKNRFSLSPFTDAGADFVSERCMSAGCARWAVGSTFAFMREFDARTGLNPNKMAGFWALDT